MWEFGLQILPLQSCELKKMPPSPSAWEAFFSIHTPGAGGFASQILTSYALDHCIYIKYSLCDLKQLQGLCQSQVKSVNHNDYDVWV